MAGEWLRFKSDDRTRITDTIETKNIVLDIGCSVPLDSIVDEAYRHRRLLLHVLLHAALLRRCLSDLSES